MEIKKAVITAAGKNQQSITLQSLVDRDGHSKTALQIILEEALQAGIEQIGLVIQPGDEAAFARAAGPHASRIRFLPQAQPLGYAHAVHCAKDFVHGEPFLLMVGDHLYISQRDRNCAQQLMDTARTQSCAISAVQATHESKLPYYGAVGGRLAPNQQGLYVIEQVLEKPTPTEAEQKIIVPGLRTGHYLCFFGMHVLTPLIMDLLEQQLKQVAPSQRLSLSPALSQLAQRERYLACELQGRRFDIGIRYGHLIAQLALAIQGQDRDEVLSHLVELLALDTPTRKSQA